jgi:hypothetical protein
MRLFGYVLCILNFESTIDKFTTIKKITAKDKNAIDHIIMIKSLKLLSSRLFPK